ncbi:bifunctional 4-hydroxy-2-oxoglutarate aldolase/2-dehydro-3-deoxy-phosphogluconate aldolase [Terrilactibacillus sp. BCM23-1]|uniref:Bifunctional 4-hydroxy-2-oxoglutarate aldolase/2-dehydro-3-deoxy-phosphogluconate aldolase n=1 Tax=Terrilactibacillus tamarindi TaxID=2599694 RepID=A0A6N8CKU8_9BACI|nr:bifunctional 2-keto-4-hydroxyglutarate aldolase/2-keto-3-deoxy-6-phosphogluconate aldolase [Terrilactibacillus tamarindi]MTT30419.1 bifunctional 4-hydroxy-2-oxoglutarate aldolase/2-dehydro-3-deoxy-phosphogluconate aldolase [Terrilactibacillus tamarindi]
MLNKYEVLNKMNQGRLVAVVRGSDAEDAINISESCIRGGIQSIEVAFTTPNCLEAIRKLADQERDALIGAGTVLDPETARLSILYGAAFVVSPNFSKAICEVCNLYSVPYLPGCLTVSEMVEALKAGVDVVKVFPGSTVGTGFIKNIKGPLPNIQLMPTGGVNLQNVTEWLDQGCFAVGVGSVLTKGAEKGNYTCVEENAEQFAHKVSAYSC